MVLKAAVRTAQIAWSGDVHDQVMLAAGTDAQQLDATFSTTATLEVLGVDVSQAGQEMPVLASVQASSRFHKLVWSPPSSTMAAGGLLIGGMEDGVVSIWNESKLLAGDPSSLVCQTDHHSGPVRALSVNPLAGNLLASGSANAEVYIWDLNKPDTHLTAGPKASPPDDVSCVAWNRQVQYILGTTAASGRSIVWDLRASKPIIQFTDGKMQNKALCWHPENATQLVTASENDHNAIVQLWDLRSASAPVKELSGHSKGILGMDWCPRDSSMLLTCGKDNRTVCWDPITEDPAAQVVTELPRASNWVFDVKWCNKDPGLIATVSFDGHITVNSLTGNHDAAAPADASASPFQLAEGHSADASLTHAPKWFKRPVGATFAYGGKLVSFTAASRRVAITSCSLRPETVADAGKLAAAVAREDDLGGLTQFCEEQANALGAADPDRRLWLFLQASLDPETRPLFLDLLQLGPAAVRAEVAAGMDGPGGIAQHGTVDHSLGPVSAPGDLFGVQAQGADRVVCRALLSGNFEAAVDLCLHENRLADALALGVVSGGDLLARVQKEYFSRTQSSSSVLLAHIINRDWLGLVKNSHLACWKETLACLLTYASPDELAGLCEQLGTRLELDASGGFRNEALLCYVCAGSVDKLVAATLALHSPAGPSGMSSHATQQLIGKATVLRRALCSRRKAVGVPSPAFVACTCRFAEELAQEGALGTALQLLRATVGVEGLDDEARATFDRLTYAYGHSPAPVEYGGPVVAARGGAAMSGSMGAAGSAYGGQPMNGYPNMQQQQQQQQQQMPAQQPQQMPAQQPQQQQQQVTFKAPRSAQPQTYAPPMTPVPTPMQAPMTPAGPPQTPYNAYATPMSTPQHAYQPPQPMQAPPSAVASAQPTPSRTERNASRRWNDPPPLTKKSGKTYQAPSAITNPLLQNSAAAPPAGQQAPAYGGQQGYQQQQQQQQYQAAPQQQQQYQAAPQQQQQQQYQQQQGYSPQQNFQQQQQQQQQQQSPPKPEPEPEPPLPAQFEPLMANLNATLQACQQHATPAYKRKLEDVDRRLKILKSKLAYDELDDHVPVGLAALADALKQRNYQLALAHHTQLVTTGNPDQTGQFLNGVKVLISIAKNMGQ